MIVDDSKSIILKIENYLEKLGYKDTHSFSTGKDALSGYKKTAKGKSYNSTGYGLA